MEITQVQNNTNSPLLKKSLLQSNRSFSQSISRKQSFFDDIKCINGNKCNKICFKQNITDKNIRILCFFQKCQCHQKHNHQNSQCLSIPVQMIDSLLMQKINNSQTKDLLQMYKNKLSKIKIEIKRLQQQIIKLEKINLTQADNKLLQLIQNDKLSIISCQYFTNYLQQQNQRIKPKQIRFNIIKQSDAIKQIIELQKLIKSSNLQYHNEEDQKIPEQQDIKSLGWNTVSDISTEVKLSQFSRYRKQYQQKIKTTILDFEQKIRKISFKYELDNKKTISQIQKDYYSFKQNDKLKDILRSIHPTCYNFFHTYHNKQISDYRKQDKHIDKEMLTLERRQIQVQQVILRSLRNIQTFSSKIINNQQQLDSIVHQFDENQDQQLEFPNIKINRLFYRSSQVIHKLKQFENSFKEMIQSYRYINRDCLLLLRTSNDIIIAIPIQIFKSAINKMNFKNFSNKGLMFISKWNDKKFYSITNQINHSVKLTLNDKVNHKLQYNQMLESYVTFQNFIEKSSQENIPKEENEDILKEQNFVQLIKSINSNDKIYIKQMECFSLIPVNISPHHSEQIQDQPCTYIQNIQEYQLLHERRQV